MVAPNRQRGRLGCAFCAEGPARRGEVGVNPPEQCVGAFIAKPQIKPIKSMWSFYCAPGRQQATRFPYFDGVIQCPSICDSYNGVNVASSVLLRDIVHTATGRSPLTTKARSENPNRRHRRLSAAILLPAKFPFRSATQNYTSFGR